MRVSLGLDVKIGMGFRIDLLLDVFYANTVHACVRVGSVQPGHMITLSMHMTRMHMTEPICFGKLGRRGRPTQGASFFPVRP